MRKSFYPAVLMLLSLAATAGPGAAQTPAESMDRTVDTIIQRENELMAALERYTPIVETYIQHFSPDKELGAVPSGDRYFLTRLDRWKDREGHSMLPEPGFLSKVGRSFSQLYSINYLRMGLAQMIVPDTRGLRRDQYDFRFVRREFLGDVRCLVFDVQPRPAAGNERFSGRIWVEDEGLNIVRFNGTQGKSGLTKLYFHADSWRQNVRPGLWLPVYVYSEETDLSYPPFGRKLNFKAQTRLWGYSIGQTQEEQERATLTVESPSVRDGAESTTPDSSPVLALRAWERQAENNVIERMQKAGLLAPEGEMDGILKQVVNNLEITNNLVIDPPIRTRILLTAPLESFTIGRTIVLSRGLIDVLPDEASLAAVLAHEVAHIVLAHRMNTRYAFHDRMLFEDHKAFEELFVKRTRTEEREADAKAVELLKNSPYNDSLGNAGLFLQAVQARAKKLPNLLRAHMGNRFADGGRSLRLDSVAKEGPKLEMTRVDQIAALPLGGRLRVDPWNGSAALIRSKPVPLLDAREKMPFEITPLFPYLTRAETQAGAAGQR